MLLLGLLGLHFVVLLGLAGHQGVAYLDGRYFFLMVLYALPFAGAGLAWTLTVGVDRLRVPRWVPVAVFSVLCRRTGCLGADPAPSRGAAVRPAAAWIRTQVAGTPVIVTNIAKLTYHAGAERVELAGSYDEILRRGRARVRRVCRLLSRPALRVSPDFLARLNPADLEFATTFPEPFPSAPIPVSTCIACTGSSAWAPGGTHQPHACPLIRLRSGARAVPTTYAETVRPRV